MTDAYEHKNRHNRFQVALFVGIMLLSLTLLAALIYLTEPEAIHAHPALKTPVPELHERRP